MLTYKPEHYTEHIFFAMVDGTDALTSTEGVKTPFKGFSFDAGEYSVLFGRLVIWEQRQVVIEC
jgi:hypothetical protein